jgi:hypothetical protein
MFKVLNPFGKALTHSEGYPMTFETVEAAQEFADKYEPYRYAFWIVPVEQPAPLSGSWFQ